MKREEVKTIVLNALTNTVNDMTDINNVELNESTHLLSEGSFIDSLALVSFIIELESTFADEFDINISLTDDNAMMRAKSPFNNVKSLVDYIYELVSEV